MRSASYFPTPLHRVYNPLQEALPMLIMPIAVFSALLLLLLAELKPKPGKSPEKELGEALANYLSKGVKVRDEKDN
ncbi:MAG: hypothetical protein H7Z11_07255 [Verrucomicrobia bacterium]|nr:hypothetical protein [Leptolyngbya sp. ES-bin-22]